MIRKAAASFACMEFMIHRRTRHDYILSILRGMAYKMNSRGPIVQILEEHHKEVEK
jgi:hypothetical protein